MKNVMALIVGLGLLPGTLSAAKNEAFAVIGLDGAARQVGLAELEKMPAVEVSAADPHTKKAETYRGGALSIGVLVEAADGYKVAFGLAELDPSVRATDAILAYRREGKALESDIGPFRVVVPSDKRGARWVRQVTAIRLIRLGGAPRAAKRP